MWPKIEVVLQHNAVIRIRDCQILDKLQGKSRSERQRKEVTQRCTGAEGRVKRKQNNKDKDENDRKKKWRGSRAERGGEREKERGNKGRRIRTGRTRKEKGNKN